MESSTRPRAIFMAFGTKGDVFPIAAIAAAFAYEQTHYNVIFITHSAHQSLDVHLAEKGVIFIPISSPPILSVHQVSAASDSELQSFSMCKKRIQAQHRQECLSAVERVFVDGSGVTGDFIAINFFALEGWSLAELYQVQCVVAAPYVVPYSAPSSFERQFVREFPLLFKYLQEAPTDKYGFSKEIVESPGYWPSNIHVCGFWFLPMDWQFSCGRCREMMSSYSHGRPIQKSPLCSDHTDLQHFLVETSSTCLPIFVGLSSVGRMGFLKNPQAFLLVLRDVLEISNYRFILFSAGYEPLDAAIQMIAGGSSNSNELQHSMCSKSGTLLFNNRLFCFSGTMPYSWLFPKCAVVIHHGGSGSTAAALHAGIPQIVCPFLLDQFYWAERLFWLGVAPEPLRREHLVPDSEDARSIKPAADALSMSIKHALSPEMKDHASRVSERISSEDGVAEALKILKDNVIYPSKEED